MRSAIVWTEPTKGVLHGNVILSSANAIEEEIKNMPVDRPSLRQKDYTKTVQFCIDVGGSAAEQKAAAKHVEEFMDFYYPDWKNENGVYKTDLEPSTEQSA